MATSLVIVGSGPWAKKVRKLMLEPRIFDSVSSIGARDLLKFNNQETALYIKDSIIWLCTSSKFQLEILEKLVETKNKIIIEKPIYDSVKNRENLQNIIKTKSGGIFLSKPWLYSEIWKKINYEVKKESSNLSIYTRRFGDTTRNYLYPPQDWLFHDSYLIYDLFKIKSVNEVVKIETIWSSNNTTLSASLLVGNTNIFMDGGYSEKREASWTVLSTNNRTLFDFNDLKSNLVPSYSANNSQSDLKVDSSLLTMILHIIQTHSDNSSLDIINLVENLLIPI
jgi:hypothetical protein